MLAEASLLVALSVAHGHGTDACLGAARLEKSVERRLGRKVFVTPERAQLRLVVTYERHGAEIEARIVVSDIDGRARGSRALVTSSHCSALDDSLALSLALLVDRPPEPEPETAVAPPRGLPTATAPGIPPRATTLVIPPEVAAPREPWHAHVGLAASALWGSLPSIEPGAALYMKLVPHGFYPVLFEAELLARAVAERDASSGARFRLLRAALALCPPLRARATSALGFCVGQRLGWLEAAGYGFDHAAEERRLSFALSAGAEGSLKLWGPFSLRGYLGVEVPVLRDRFSSGGRGAAELFRAAPVAGAGEIGVESTLW